MIPNLGTPYPTPTPWNPWSATPLYPTLTPYATPYPSPTQLPTLTQTPMPTATPLWMPPPFPSYPGWAGQAPPTQAATAQQNAWTAHAKLGGAPITTPATTTQPDPNGFGGNNPNEPAPMKNQYNQAAINQARKPGTGTGNGAGNGAGGYQTWIDPKTGLKRSTDKRLDYAYTTLDKAIGNGFVDSFMQKHGVDPISFYMPAFADRPEAKGFQLPGPQGDAAREWLTSRAAYAAQTDAKFLPGAIDRWIQVHGQPNSANPIPQEQWDRWWSISQSTGGDPLHVGQGKDPWGVY